MNDAMVRVGVAVEVRADGAVEVQVGGVQQVQEVLQQVQGQVV